MPRLVFTRSYERAEKRFLKKHPEVVERYKNILRLLELQPTHPSLKLQGLAGQLSGRHAVSVTHSYRMIIRFVEEDEIVLLAIGSHDEVYR